MKRFIAVVLMIIGATQFGNSQSTVYWDINGTTAGAGGASPSGTWSTSVANWNSSSAGTSATANWTTAAAGNNPQFSAGTDATGPFTVTISGSVNVNTIRLEEAGTPTITGGTLNLVNGSGVNSILAGIVTAVPTPLIINSVISGSPVGGFRIARNLARGTITIGNTGNTFSTGVFISNDIELKLGASEVIPNGNVVTFTGTSLSSTFNLNGFNETVASISNGGTVTGNNNITLGANTLTLGAPAGESFGGNITGTGGSLTKNGAGALTLSSGTLSFTGTLTVGGGTLNLTQGANLTLSPSVSISSGATLNVNNSAGTITIGQVVSGAGNITKAGAGTVQLNNAANTYSGTTTVSAGKFVIDGDATIGDGTGDVIFNGGNLGTTGDRNAIVVPNDITISANTEITTTSTAAAADFRFTGTLGGSTGTLTIRNDGADAASDVFLCWFGGSGFTFSRPIVIDNGAVGTIQLNFNNSSGTQTFSGGISGNGSVRRNASGGITVLTGANTYSGLTTVTAGTLSLGHATDTLDGDITVNGGTLDVDNPDTVGAVILSSGTISGDSALTGTSYAVQSGTVSAVLAGSGVALTKTGAGTVTLSAANTYSGATTVSAGTLLVSSPGSTDAGSAVTVQTSATLGGTGTINGAVTVNSGGTLAPGASIGTLTLDTPPTLNGTTSMEVDRNGGSPLADKLVVSTGTLAYGGSLTLVNVGAAYQSGDTFDLFDAGSFSGSFTSISPSTPGTGLAWDTSNLTTDGTIAVVCTSITTQPANTNVCSGTPAGFSVAVNGSANFQWRKLDSGWGSGNDWQLTASGGNAGFLIGDSSANAGGSSGNINTSSKAFGLYANSGDTASAVRNFGSGMSVGNTFKIDMDNGWIETGGTVGFGLRNSSGENVWEFYFANGSSSYTINAGSSSPTLALPFTGHGIRLELTLTSASTYSVLITTNNGSGTFVTEGMYTGNLLSPAGGQTITQLRLFNSNAGGGSDRDAYFNRISVSSYEDSAAAYTTWNNTDNKGTGPLSNGSPYSGVTTSTLTINPATASEVGTYDMVLFNACGQTNSTSATLSINPLPTIALGADPTACAGSSATLTYSGTTESPTLYSIDFDTTAETAGFVDVNLATLPVSPIGISVPVAAPGGTYNANLTVQNANGCVSANYAISVTVNIRPTSIVSGTATICGGDSTTIQAALTGAGPWDVYWSDGVTQTSVASSPATRMVSPTALTVYTVTNLTDANCTAQAGDRTGSATVTVNTIVANTAVYERQAGGALKIYLSQLLTNASDTLLQTISLLGVGTDGYNLTSTNSVALTTNATFIGYPAAANVTDSFQYKVTDVQGCVTLGTVIINVIAAPAGLAQNITTGGGSVTVDFSGIPGYQYVVERADDVDFSVNLTNLSTNMAGLNGQFSVTDDSPPSPTAFYRLRYSP